MSNVDRLKYNVSVPYPKLGLAENTDNIELGAAPLVQHYSAFSSRPGLGYGTLIQYTIHCTLHCTLPCTLYKPLYCTLHKTLSCTLHKTRYCSPYCTSYAKVSFLIREYLSASSTVLAARYPLWTLCFLIPSIQYTHIINRPISIHFFQPKKFFL